MSKELPKFHRPSRPATTRWPENGDRNQVLLVTRGHPFARDPFYAIFESNREIDWSSVEHPAAQRFFSPDLARDFDCYVLYDMPGIEFSIGKHAGKPPRYFEPPKFYRDGLHEMTEAGVPLVILHHAIAAWPSWPEWAEIVGGRFLYTPGELRGQPQPASGYRFDTAHTVSPVIEHPITDGIEPFEIVDELYLVPVFEESIVPILRSSYDFVDTNFYSGERAVLGELNSREGWSHPPASNVVGWIKNYQRSPIVYLQFGDSPSAYANESFRAILANAIRWACSDEAREWAAKRAREA